MTRFVCGFSRRLDPETAAAELVEAIGHGRSGASAGVAAGPLPIGGLLLQTAAAGDLGQQVAQILARRWPEAHWLGASFEGIVAEGRTIRDEPALGLVAWTEGSGEPLSFAVLPFAVSAEAGGASEVAAEIAHAMGGDGFAPGDLVLLFPDTAAAPRLESTLVELGTLLQPAALAGSAASALDGPAVFLRVGPEADEVESAALVGLCLRAGKAGSARVRAAEASLPASPWLAVTRCRERWVDGLDEEPALDWVRRQLGLDDGVPIEPHLSRLLVRVAARPEAAVDAGAAGAGDASSAGAEDPSATGTDALSATGADALSATGADAPSETEAAPLVWDERYVVGLDEARGAFALPRTLRRGERIALALPDADRGRQALVEAIEALPTTPLLLQLACRARDASLHGDPDLESAWVAHHAGERPVLGTVAPFQLATGADGTPRLLVHATVLAALGPEDGSI